ncbi:MAG TPA: pyruvate formate lyase-activating protein, partial [Anaerolineae bacterium]|nr:pyruvate formate lyase-activating protein [Anaerolineae bacterium]
MMRILAVDVGTGTQDVLLFDTEKEPENALKMVMPSPTALLAQAIRAATQAGEELLLTGVT